LQSKIPVAHGSSSTATLGCVVLWTDLPSKTPRCSRSQLQKSHSQEWLCYLNLASVADDAARLDVQADVADGQARLVAEGGGVRVMRRRIPDERV
jgi:hypothetical protein